MTIWANAVRLGALALMAVPAALAAQVALDGNRLALPTPVTFATRQVAPSAESDAALDLVAGWLTEKSYVSTLRIEGHVTGTADDQALSEARAMAVARSLVAKGVDCHRLIVVGFGDTKPVAPPGSPENNRIEFVNAALRGRLIGGLPADGGGQVAGDVCQGK